MENAAPARRYRSRESLEFFRLRFWLQYHAIANIISSPTRCGDGERSRSRPMDDPLALLLTWTTYCSWSPGDERGGWRNGGDSACRKRGAITQRSYRGVGGRL
jgi:hypothetical protein